MKIELLEEVTSTNDFIRQYLGGEEDVIVCAKRQTAGRGTKGRSFLSEEGGVYLTALLHPKDLAADRAFLMMAHAAVAVCRTAEAFGADPEIKWANDILAGGRKLSGILIENILSEGKVHASIVGIGLNVGNDLAALGGIAARLCDYSACTTEEVRSRLIAELRKKSGFSEYLSYVKFCGREISVREGAREYPAVARRILPDGRLEIEADGEIRSLSAAEISISAWRQ